MNAHLGIRFSSYLYFSWVWVGIYKINGLYDNLVDCRAHAFGMEPTKEIFGYKF